MSNIIDVRLDIDIQTIPPTSTERRRFEEMLTNDLAKALRIDIDMIEILSIKPSIGNLIYNHYCLIICRLILFLLK
jgi:hypothetical protein